MYHSPQEGSRLLTVSCLLLDAVVLVVRLVVAILSLAFWGCFRNLQVKQRIPHLETPNLTSSGDY